MREAVISGSSGFIGSHLIKRLKRLKYDIVRLKRGSLYKDNFDYFFHLSAYGNHHHQKDERLTYQINVAYLQNILESLKKKKFKSFIYFSTSSVTLPIQTVYSITKKIGEKLCQDSGIPHLIIRPYSIYGPGEADFRFIPTVINKGLQGNKSKIIPNPRHDWIYIDDFIDALLLIIKNINKLKGKIIPIGTGISWSNQEVVDVINEIFGIYDNNYQSIFYDILFKDIRDYDTKEWVADNSLIRELGWQQKYSLREGLIECYKYYKKEYDSACKANT